MNLLYVKIGVAFLFILGAFATGWSMRNRDYMEYKKSVEIAAKEQEAKVESIQKQHELVTKGISDEYDAKLNLIRQYYANGVRQPSSGKLSNLSTTSAIADATAAYNELAANCAQTTLQLVELQKWINQQVGISAE